VLPAVQDGHVGTALEQRQRAWSLDGVDAGEASDRLVVTWRSAVRAAMLRAMEDGLVATSMTATRSYLLEAP
jgi:hypothetical protein